MGLPSLVVVVDLSLPTLVKNFLDCRNPDLLSDLLLCSKLFSLWSLGWSFSLDEFIRKKFFNFWLKWLFVPLLAADFVGMMVLSSLAWRARVGWLSVVLLLCLRSLG